MATLASWKPHSAAWSTPVRRARALAPGVALCVAVTAAAMALQGAERRVFGHVWLESLVLAILLGAAVRTAWTPGPLWREGVVFSAKTLLEVAVVLLGASVSAGAIMAVGPLLLVGIVAVVAVALAVSYGVGRAMGLSARMAVLVACGGGAVGGRPGGHGDIVVQRLGGGGVLKDAFPSGVTIVSDNYQDGHAGNASNAFFVLEESPIKTVADLRGKIVAVNAFGSAVDLVARVALKRQGIDPRRDLQMVEIALPNIGSAIRQKRVDCGVLVLPFQAAELKTGGLRPVFSAVDALGPSSVVFNVVSNAFLKAHPDTVRAMLSDYVGALRYLYTPGNHDTAVSVTAALTKLPPAALDYVMTERDYFRARDGALEAGLVQKPIDALVELGLLPAAVPVAKYIDMKYLPA